MVRETAPGQDLSLTIDRRLQYLAYRELKRTVLKHGARSGSVVLLDIPTGEVLAMVNQPSITPITRVLTPVVCATAPSLTCSSRAR
jgi:cell division protein FtsI (penicillin-binding protein 3)